ncbi:hypothetical protein GGTG_00110 [Gaeumannomyces tritici R3-111a-1]|uniref:Uncharacterized protein n=1 Tax=Gaeumannomyces tritici (strain R3-111a-1) TaxID=644352 RepID=J3NFR6_GAET3|nr:hypothetical protein GGTG_00110 [Gaeumannomyces tritici R3-111a-1]EJT80106.1 hypothetical protein GGTG_00110 [Gaeumannomyces tritici R3-111a-1]
MQSMPLQNCTGEQVCSTNSMRPEDMTKSQGLGYDGNFSEYNGRVLVSVIEWLALSRHSTTTSDYGKARGKSLTTNDPASEEHPFPRGTESS